MCKILKGDFERNAAFGHRTRLEFITDISGAGTLTTRLQAAASQDSLYGDYLCG